MLRSPSLALACMLVLILSLTAGVTVAQPRVPRYAVHEINHFGRTMRGLLPYPTPLSAHAKPRDWYTELNTNPPWHDHVIIQKKIKKLPTAADWISRNHALGATSPSSTMSSPTKVPVTVGVKPTSSNPTLAPSWAEGTALPANKKGHYFFGNFKASEHHAADNLLWLRETIDEHVTFWRMAPIADATRDDNAIGIFANVHPDFRALAWPDHEYVLGTNRARTDLRAELPTGRWEVTCYDAIAKDHKRLASEVSVTFEFDSPKSRAAFVHFKRIDR